MRLGGEKLREMRLGGEKLREMRLRGKNEGNET